jgi:hypothetical protein
MSKKLFISYSHKDESYREALEEHLAILKRKNIVSTWHDRKILAGDEWKDQIDSNLEAADIIIFLVSSSFLASNYCFDVEVEKAMERHQLGAARIVSIIVRPCDWHDCEFSKFQAVPKDAVPISKAVNVDSAWLDVVQSLKKLIADFTPSQISHSPIEKTPTDSIQLNQVFSDWLDDTEIVLTHRKVDKVRLSDIYVSLDIEYKDSKKKETKTRSTDFLFTSKGNYLVYGEEQQGKTTLLKHSFVEFLKKKFLPIYLDAKTIKNSDLNKTVTKLLSEQYIGLDLESYLAYDQRVLLIDNLDNIELNPKFRNIFLKQIRDVFDWVIITCHSSYNYVSLEVEDLYQYQESSLLGFGNVKREEVVKRWVTLGVEETIQEAELYARCDDLKVQLNTVIKKNIVPTKPIYILMAIQIFEAYTQKNLELTSYGHCYQQLIYQSFEKAQIKNSEYEKYLNVLTEFSWARFKLNKGLNQFQLDELFDSYNKVFLTVNFQEVIQNLLRHSLLVKKDALIDFKYPYIYYFFVGKKIAEGFADTEEIKLEVELEVESLLENLHREDFANILIFITHHTKDSWVFSKIQQVLSKLFESQPEASLAKDQLLFMDEFIKKIPELVVEQREVHKERESQNKRLDEMEKSEDLSVDDSNDTLAKINKTFKGMELAGQIIRNRHASMKRDAIYNLADSGMSSGLRFLDYFIKISDEFKLEIIKFIETRLADHPNLTNREIQNLAQDTYLQMTYGVINGVIRKIAASIGSKEATEVYADLEGKANTPAHTLINLAIELQFKRVLDISIIERTLDKLKSNPVCTRILKEIVIQHVYMFPVEYQVKQQLSELFKVSVVEQRLMDQKTAKKG